MNHARFWLLGGVLIALMAFQASPTAAQQFPGFSKKLEDYKLSESATAIVYRDTKGKKRVGLIRDRRRTGLKVKFSRSTQFSNITMIGEALFFIAEDKAWSVKYFWTPDNGRLHFVAANAARKKKVTSKGLRKTSLAYLVLTNPGPKKWWLAEQKGKGREISEETSSNFSFHFGGVVLNRRNVLLAYEINARGIPLGTLEYSLSFQYRLLGGKWKPKRIKLDGLPRPAPDLNGDGINEVVVVNTSYYRARTSKYSELIWWDKKTEKFIKSGIKTEFHFGDAPLREPYQEFKESTFKFQMKAKPFPLIMVKGQQKRRNEETEEIENSGSFQRNYQWNPAKQAFMQIGGK